jgi:hypothetical protein
MSDVIDGETFEEFAEHLFADENCEECHNDASCHEPWVVMGHWFAHCKVENAPCRDCGRTDLPLHVDYRCPNCHQLEEEPSEAG